MMNPSLCKKNLVMLVEGMNSYAIGRNELHDVMNLCDQPYA